MLFHGVERRRTVHHVRARPAARATASVTHRGRTLDPDAIRTLYERIEARARAIAEARPWPCRRGRDGCCRRLGEIPALTRAEWVVLWKGYLALPAPVRADIRRQVETLEAPPVVCPFLERDRGECRVYAHRPAACRAYGFYRGRAHDAFCGLIEDSLDVLEAAGPPIVWGNHDALEDELERRFGPRIGLVEWFAEHEV